MPSPPPSDKKTSSTMASKTSTLTNPWEAVALEHSFKETASSTAAWKAAHDPLIYPGLYSATGFDMMTILLQLASRPCPAIELGAIDCSVALVLCDLQRADMPIVYASDAFCELTGYSQSEVIGKNCRFLQSPGSSSLAPPKTAEADIQKMSQALHNSQEIQLEVINYKKNGQPFRNALSIVPLNVGHLYAVGLLAEL